MCIRDRNKTSGIQNKVRFLQHSFSAYRNKMCIRDRTYTDQACLLDIQDPQNKESQSFHYAVVPRGVEAENIPADYTVIETPIRSVICRTSLQLSNFIKLEELDAVVGITSTRHLFNKKINDRLTEGSIHKIGIEGNFDNEVIMSVNPDLILRCV